MFTNSAAFFLLLSRQDLWNPEVLQPTFLWAVAFACCLYQVITFAIVLLGKRWDFSWLWTIPNGSWHLTGASFRCTPIYFFIHGYAFTSTNANMHMHVYVTLIVQFSKKLLTNFLVIQISRKQQKRIVHSHVGWWSDDEYRENIWGNSANRDG